MKGVNLVLLLGRLGNDPETTTLAGGATVSKFSVATSEVWVGKDGQKQEKTEWHRVVVWGKLAEVCSKYLSKGSVVHVKGKVSYRKWEDQQGQTKYSTEIVANELQFLSNKKGNGGGGSNQYEESQGEQASDFGPEPKFDDSDEIPF